MSVNHSVPRVLVGANNIALQAAGSGFNALTQREFGFFTPNGVSITTGAEGDDFILAVGLESGFVRTDVINKKNLVYATASCPSAVTSPVVDLRNICALCSPNTDGQGIKVHFTAANVWLTDGPRAFIKSYDAGVECCTAPNCVELVRTLRNLINADTDALFTATARNPTTNAELNDAALDAWDSDANGCPDLRLTANGQSIADFCGIPYQYYYPSGVSFEITTYGFQCCSPKPTTVVVTAPVFGNGLGADVKFLEWSAAPTAQNGEPLPFYGHDVVVSRMLNAVPASTYALITLAVNDPHTSGYLTYQDPKTYVIAIPTGASTTADPLVTLLDTLLGTDLESSLTCFTFA